MQFSQTLSVAVEFKQRGDGFAFVKVLDGDGQQLGHGDDLQLRPEDAAMFVLERDGVGEDDLVDRTFDQASTDVVIGQDGMGDDDGDARGAEIFSFDRRRAAGLAGRDDVVDEKRVTIMEVAEESDLVDAGG